MGHDSQLARELPEVLRERSNDSPILDSKQRTSLDILGQWWEVYGQIYRDDPTPTLLVSFREILKPLLSKPEIMHQALLIGARQSPQFRPSPGRIFEIAETLMERQQQISNRPKYLDEPQLSEAEREAAVAETPAGLRAKLTGKVNGSQGHDAKCLCPGCRARRELES